MCTAGTPLSVEVCATAQVAHTLASDMSTTFNAEPAELAELLDLCEICVFRVGRRDLT